MQTVRKKFAALAEESHKMQCVLEHLGYTVCGDAELAPLWSDAPDWAMWRAKNIDGAWYWFESKPDMSDCGWRISKDFRVAHHIWPDFGSEGWRNTLTHRPDAVYVPLPQFGMSRR